MKLYDDEDYVKFRKKMKAWEKRLARLDDETLVHIIQVANYQLNIRQEKGHK